MTDDADEGNGDAGSNIPQNLSARLASDSQRYRVDELFDALSHRRRRLVLYYLNIREETCLDDLARWVAATEAETSESEVRAEQREDVAIDLFHVHLPKLTDVKVVEYDRRSGDVRYRDPPETVERLLEASSLAEIK